MTWKMRYYLDRGEYAPLQGGSMSAEVTNTCEHQLLVTRAILHFDWQGDEHRYWYADCSIEVKPGQTVRLPEVRFTIKLNAPLGASLYAPGVVYKRVERDEWVLKGPSYVTTGGHVLIKEAEKRDFTVFISHSNHKDDEALLKECRESLEKCGLNPYIAEESAEPGGPLWEKIHRAIKQSDAILVLWTKWAGSSGDVREEIGLAIGSGKGEAIIPLVETGTEVQGSLKSRDLEYIPLDRQDTISAMSRGMSRALEWAQKKKEKRSPGIQSE